MTKSTSQNRSEEPQLRPQARGVRAWDLGGTTGRRRAALALFGLALLCAAPRSAWAANPSDQGCNQDDECRGHFQKGQALYKKQDYKNALNEFQTAYERRQTPILLANIGRTLQKLGRPKEALEYYQRCQEAAKSDTELQEKLARYIAETKPLIANAPEPPKEPKEQAEPPEPAPALLPLTESLTPVEKKQPVHKRGWFIAVMVVGSVLVVGGAVTAGVLLGTRSQPDPPLDPGVMVIRPIF